MSFLKKTVKTGAKPPPDSVEQLSLRLQQTRLTDSSASSSSASAASPLGLSNFLPIRTQDEWLWFCQMLWPQFEQAPVTHPSVAAPLTYPFRLLFETPLERMRDPLVVCSIYASEGHLIEAAMRRTAPSHPGVMFASVLWSCLPEDRQHAALAVSHRSSAVFGAEDVVTLCMLRGSWLAIPDAAVRTSLHNKSPTPDSLTALIQCMQARKLACTHEYSNAIAQAQGGFASFEKQMQAVMSSERDQSAHLAYGDRQDGRIRNGRAILIAASEFESDWCTPLGYATSDALAMLSILRRMHFTVVPVFNRCAADIAEVIRETADSSVAGQHDGLLLMYIGHGADGYVAASILDLILAHDVKGMELQFEPERLCE